jgi:hydrophobe/amphiphile efflux-1 (HAE1) family protein
MVLSDLSIKRPVFAWMIMFALIIFGAICFSRMGISQLPDVDFPMLTVSARYPGAAPEVMEADVISPVEDAVMSLQGVKTVSSTARNGIANIMIEFTLDRNVDLALQDLQGKISQIESQLPKNLEPLVISKVNPDEFPILWLSVANPDVLPQDLMTYVRDNIRDQLASVPGVGSLWTPGFLQPNLRVWVEPQKLNQYALTVQDIVSTLQTEHLEPPGGRVEYQNKEFNLRTLGEAKSPKQFEKIQVTSRGGAPNYNPVQLGQVARIEEGTEDVLQFARSNGKAAVGVGVVKQRGANAVEVARAIKKKMTEIEKTAPKGVKLFINYDATLFIEEAIGELSLTLALSALLTALVCWLFLGSWTSTLNVILAIPTSIVGSFIILYSLHFTLNMFTLLGLSLAIGIVVDDAIMVLENIIRHREMGKSRHDSAVVGAREITFAAMAATVSIIAIFLPIALIQGIIGKFLYQFGVTMTAAVALSLLEALTLTPMRASKFVEISKRTTRIGKGFEASMHWVREFYARTLTYALGHRWKVLIASFVFFVVSFGSVSFLNKEFQPAQDQGSLMVKLTTPIGSSLSYTNEKLKLVEDFLLKRSEVDTTFAAAGGFTGGEVNTAIVFVSMKPRGKRGVDSVLKHELSQQELIPIVRDHLLKVIPDSRPVVQDPSQQGFSSNSGFPIEFTVQGPDWEKLAVYSKQIMAEMKATGLMTDVDSDYEAGAPEVQIVPDRQKAAEHGVNVSAIGQTVNAAMGGVIAGRYSKGQHRYDVRVKAVEELRATADRIRDLTVRNNRGERIPLMSVVNVVQTPAASSISRKNRQRAITVTAGLTSGKSLQDALDVSHKIANKILPASEGYKVFESGSTEEFKESFKGMIFALGIGLVVAYMVLGSQFNSFIDPITVFMALPFSFSGAFLGLLIGRQSLNIFSMIGLVLLMGLVKKNSILLVDFTNQLRDEGKLSVRDALLQACPTRLRPILMTSIATIAGAIPAALAIGPGSESRAPMSYAVMGGVLVSTLLTLYVVPCVYSFLSRFEKRENVH